MTIDFDSTRLPNPHLSEEHIEWRNSIRRFFDKEVIPYADEWDEACEIPDDLWIKASAVGLLGLGYSEEYGGRTISDRSGLIRTNPTYPTDLD